MPSASCARGPPLPDGEGPVQTRVADRVEPEAVSRDTGDGAGRAGLRPRPSWGRTGWVERRPGTIADGAAGRGRVGFWPRRVDLAVPHEAAARAGLPKGGPSRATGGSWPDPEARSPAARQPPAGPVRSGAVARGARRNLAGPLTGPRGRRPPRRERARDRKGAIRSGAPKSRTRPLQTSRSSTVSRSRPQDAVSCHRSPALTADTAA